MASCFAGGSMCSRVRELGSRPNSAANFAMAAQADRCIPTAGLGLDVPDSFDVSKRPFRAVQQISVPATPEGVGISPDGKWIVVSSMAGSNLTADDPGRKKLGRVGLYAIRNGQAVKVNELPGGEAAQGVVFSKDSKTVLVQFDVERAIAVYAVRGGKLVDTGQRISFAAGPVSIRSMPR